MKTCHTTARIIEAMAFRGGHPIEIHDDTAFLQVGNIVWIAPLAPAGGAR